MSPSRNTSPAHNPDRHQFRTPRIREPTATATANARLHETRYFLVPRTIAPSGRTFMGEHIRIGYFGPHFP